MTVETKLRSAMAEAVAPAHADTERLVSAARRRGMGIRRRRQALGAVGVAAAVLVATVAPNVVASDHTHHIAPQPLTSGGSPTPRFNADKTTPFTGRSTAAALLYAVQLQASGGATSFAGADPDPGPMPETYAFFRFTPRGSATSGEVAINIQPDFLGPDVKPGDDRASQVRELTQCQTWMTRCSATHLGDGSWLTTYDDRSDYQHGRGIRRVAALYRADGLRLVVSASNGYDVTERDEQITRDEPVLTTEQLVAIVRQPWWGTRLPSYFVEQGAELEPYHDGSSTRAITSPIPGK